MNIAKDEFVTINITTPTGHPIEVEVHSNEDLFGCAETLEPDEAAELISKRTGLTTTVRRETVATYRVKD